MGLAGWLVVAISTPGCNGPQAPEAPGVYDMQFDRATSGVVFRLESPDSRSAGVDLLATAVRHDRAGHRVHVEVALRSRRPDALLGPPGVEVFDCAPAGVWPLNAGCVPPQPGGLPEQCLFGHAASYGEDRMLSPGEISAPVEWIFENPAGDSFRCHVRLWWPHGS